MYYGIAILSRVIGLVVLGNGDACKRRTTGKSTILNLSHRFWDENARQVGATKECESLYFLHRRRKRDARDFLAIPECPVLYLCLPFRYDGLAILDVIAAFLVIFHDSSFFMAKGQLARFLSLCPSSLSPPPYLSSLNVHR